MRIVYRREGGFAHMPGLSQPLELDTRGLGAEQARRLEELVAGADLFARPRAEPAPSRSADIYSYTLTVQVGRRRRTLRLHDPIDEPALQALLSYLEELRASGAGSGAA